MFGPGEGHWTALALPGQDTRGKTRGICNIAAILKMKDQTAATTTTHFIPPFRNNRQLKEKMIKIKIKGYQLLEITKKPTSSGSWFK